MQLTAVLSDQWPAYSGAVLIGAVNEALAQWRDGGIGGSAGLPDREKIYVGLMAAGIVGLPLLASLGTGVIGELGEGAFDGFVALAFRNTARAITSKGTMPNHVPL